MSDFIWHNMKERNRPRGRSCSRNGCDDLFKDLKWVDLTKISYKDIPNKPGFT